jgi:nucleosome binding factor SPN SPT16 subunit
MKNEGYLIIDHRAGPGLTDEQARKAGYEPFQCTEGKVFESATKSCKHCRNIVVLSPTRIRARNYCQMCGGEYVCDRCAAMMREPGYIHMPFEKVLDIVKEYEAKGIVPDIEKLWRR